MNVQGIEKTIRCIFPGVFTLKNLVILRESFSIEKVEKPASHRARFCKCKLLYVVVCSLSLWISANNSIVVRAIVSIVS